MPYVSSPDRHRLVAVLVAAAIEIGLALLLIAGLAARFAGPSRVPAVVTFTASERRVPPPPPSPPPRKPDPGEAAPKGHAAAALARAAPLPKLAVAIPSPAAGTAGNSAETSAGNPEGSGRVSGTGPRGEGAGSGGGAVSAPLRIAGALRDSDFPRGAPEAAAGGVVAIAFRVRSDGRVDRCRVIVSSGVALLDALTCRLVERRFRYRPAGDDSGAPVDAELRTSFTWGMRRRE